LFQPYFHDWNWLLEDTLRFFFLFFFFIFFFFFLLILELPFFTQSAGASFSRAI